MTKKDVYEQVVRLTAELSQTGIAENIFDAVSKGQVERVNGIIGAFPDYYIELWIKIHEFGLEFKELIGESTEDKYNEMKIHQDGDWFMEGLLKTEIIGQIAEAADTGDATKLQEVIINFKKNYPLLADGLVRFQKKYSEYKENNHHTGWEGAIFGTEADEENDVFVFDTNIIDARSFYVFTILADIDDFYFFYDEKVEYDGEELVLPDNDAFLDAIEEVTNEAFAAFIANYNLLDWIGKDREYQSVGEILVAAFEGEFEDDEE